MRTVKDHRQKGDEFGMCNIRNACQAEVEEHVYFIPEGDNYDIGKINDGDEKGPRS